MKHPLVPPLLLFFGAFLVGWIYQTPPSLGDDLNYWGLAFDLHHNVPGAWSRESFHDLRWPVWGLCWLLQIPFGFSALSYYLQPMVYLGAGAVVVYFLAKEIGLTRLAAFTAGILFLFHPELDTLIDRPMPDLSEGFWVALSFLLWLKIATGSRSTVANTLLAAGVGLSLAIGQANRITGVFAIPVLVVVTLLLYPRRFLWLMLCGAFAALFVGIEMAIYFNLTGDPLHSLHANLTARGRTGTEAIPIWEFPIRFLPGLFRRYSDIIYNLVAIVGLVPAVLMLGKRGRALAAYAIIYLLTYSCAPQSLSPLRPLVRDGDRFLGSLAYPLSILSALGLITILRLALPFLDKFPPVRWLQRRPAVTLSILCVLLGMLATRPLRGPNYLDEIAAYLATVPPDTQVLSHPAMRHVAHMADGRRTESLNWRLRKDLLRPSPGTLEALAKSDAVWFNRKWIWTSTRKMSEYDELDATGPLAPYLRPPLDEWAADLTVAKGDVPDFVFLSRRRPGSSLVEHMSDGRLIKDVLLPPVETGKTWTFPRKASDPLVLPVTPIPPELRGRTFFLFLRYSSNKTEPIRGEVYFSENGEEFLDYVFKPYFFPKSSEDFFFFTIPENADALKIRLRRPKDTERITLDELRLFMEEKAPGS